MVLRAFVPGAETVERHRRRRRADRAAGTRTARRASSRRCLPKRTARFAYRLRATRAAARWTFRDPYAFGPVLGPLDDHLLVEGTHRRLYERLGAHPMTHEGVEGVHFAVWAPNAQRVSVVGDFNAWDGRRHVDAQAHRQRPVGNLHPRRRRRRGLQVRDHRRATATLLPLKADPFGFAAELRPSTASVVARTDDFALDRRGLDGGPRADAMRGARRCRSTRCISARGGARAGRRLPDLRRARRRADPLRGRPGLHPSRVACRSPSIRSTPPGATSRSGCSRRRARFGDPAGFARFVDRAHEAGLGVILDWVPAHFPTDVHGLAHFDGDGALRARRSAARLPSRLEHRDLRFRPARGRERAWSASALYWLDRFHIDGLRVDAVASMLYLDYSRKPGEWLPNADGGNENRDAVAFLQRINDARLRRPSRRRHDRRGIDRLARRVASGRCRRPRLRLQVEHGLDARHAGLYVATSRCTALAPRRADLRPALRLHREFRSAARPRRSGARQGLDPRPHAGRRLAAVRQPARLLRLHVGLSGQEAAVHGPGIRPGPGVERRPASSTGTCSTIRCTAACSDCVRDLNRALSRRAGAARARLRGARASAGSWSTTPTSRCSPGCGCGGRATPPVAVVVQLHAGAAAPATASACRAPGRWREMLNTDAARLWRVGHGQPRARRRRSRRRRTVCPPPPNWCCRRLRPSICGRRTDAA